MPPCRPRDDDIMGVNGSGLFGLLETGINYLAALWRLYQGEIHVWKCIIFVLFSNIM